MTKKLGMILLAAWLVLTGILALLYVSGEMTDALLPILAIAAGVALFVEDRPFGHLDTELDTFLLSIWLILQGIFALTDLTFNGQDTVMAVLAIAAGALFLFED